MSTTIVQTPTSRCRFGIARQDVTPPVGIYHRFWGAAAHDRASGVHRPLTATVLLLQPDSGEHSQRTVCIALDHCLFRPRDMQRLLDETGRRTGLAPSQIVFTFSHTHSGGNITRERRDLPGGDLIGPYLDELPGRLAEAFLQAEQSTVPATFTYGTATCAMGRQRDYWDAERQQFVCGYNPDHRSHLPVHVIRVTDRGGRLLANIVHYPCHPTTLAWENTLISPDYIGALRETVEAGANAPCVFLLGPCGDVGPRVGFVGDPAVADANGRQVAYAALAALEGLPPAESDFHYCGPVISGATLGTWEFRRQSSERLQRAAAFEHRVVAVELPYRPGLPTAGEATREMEQYLSDEAAAREAGNSSGAADARALAERKRRLLERIGPLPPGEGYPFQAHIWKLGDAFWVAVEGEPYFALQEELQRRIAPHPVLVVPLANGSRCSYLPTREAYEKPLYQVDVSLLAPGCLEMLTDALATEIGGMCHPA